MPAGWSPTTALYAAAAAALALLVAVPASAQADTGTPSVPSAPSQSVVSTTGWYSPQPADTVTIYEPDAPGPFPAVIFVHGGAWGRSQPIDGEFQWADDLAQQQGWLVAVIGYPAKIPREQVVEPRAIAWAVDEIAHRSDVASSSVALWGESAGAHLALVAAYRDARTLRPLVSGVVSVSGPTDMRTEYRSSAEVWLHAVSRFEGMSPRAARAAGSRRYSATSPVDLVNRRVPPTFQAISRADPLVPADQVRILTQRLHRADVMHQSVWLRGDAHSTTLESQTPAGGRHTVQELAVAFLEKVFARHRVSFD